MKSSRTQLETSHEGLAFLRDHLIARRRMPWQVVAADDPKSDIRVRQSLAHATSLLGTTRTKLTCWSRAALTVVRDQKTYTGQRPENKRDDCYKHSFRQGLMRTGPKRQIPVDITDKLPANRRFASLLAVSVIAAVASTAPPAFAAVSFGQATVATVGQLDLATNGHCGFSRSRAYLWRAETTNTGWAIAQPEARDPIGQPDGFVLLHRLHQRWTYVTCGSDISSPAIGRELEARVPVPRLLVPSQSTRQQLAALIPRGYSQLDFVEVTAPINGIAWASALPDGTVGQVMGSALIFREVLGEWSVFERGTEQGLLPDPNDPNSGNTTSRNVPAIVLKLLADKMYAQLGAS